MRRIKDDRGSAIVFTVLSLTALLAVAALAVDVGSWYRADRKLQAKVDAAALAGVQELPYDPGKATSVALNYAQLNGAGPNPTVAITGANDTIKVTGAEQAPGIFSKLVGIDSVTVHAEASAKASGLSQARLVAPLGVSDTHPMLQCVKTKPPASCYGPTTIVESKLSTVPGSFGWLSLDGSNAGASSLEDWIKNGYPNPLGVNKWYDAATGAKSSTCEALNLVKGKDLLFPVYATDSAHAPNGNGQSGKYYIIGWVVFQVTGASSDGNKCTVAGTFKGITWVGLEGPVSQSFGVRIVRLTQ
jgi:Flp pilus assembly protein TadG